MPVQKHMLDLDFELNHGLVAERSTGLERIAYRFLPRSTWLTLKYETKLFFLRIAGNRVASRLKNSEDLLVNIGAGSKGRKGWVNIDAFHLPGITLACDARRRLPLPDGCAKIIYCEHFLEHIDYTEDIPQFLAECKRVLKAAGILRIIVPDGEKYLRAYASPGWEEITKVGALTQTHRDPHYDCNYNTKMELVNMVFRQGGQHKYCYDYDTLERLLHTYGFSRVHRESFNQSAFPEACIDSPEYSSESLYVEATN